MCGISGSQAHGDKMSKYILKSETFLKDYKKKHK